MIVVNLDMLSKFKVVSNNMRIAIEYLETADIDSFADGKYEIKGDDVYAMVSSYTTFPAQEREYETHDRYADIQYVFSGKEDAFYADKRGLSSTGAYIPDKDKQNFVGEQQAVIRLQPGVAAIFLPNDAHKVCCAVDQPEPVRKFLIKVKI
ncbi:MAG: DUF386 domain-containing protein [Ruminococcaceae bacterium]|jgi:YhcH/YjgK/YiaL family protein|nr:DUF386 domain-containing protein [Oscillospiraceae bacterium]